MNTTSGVFGCGSCWPASAEVAWEGIRRLRTDIELVDESHFMIKIRSCMKCAQSFVSVFTETIDWEDGDDPQYWTVMPLTPPEAKQLAAAGDAVEAALAELPVDRRSLQRDAPKGADPSSYWRHGLSVGSHD